MNRALPIIILITAIAGASPAAASFQLGDLYYFTHDLPPGGYGIVRIEPGGGVTTLWSRSTFISHKDLFTYDPFRGVLLYSTFPDTLKAIDADGNVSIPVPGLQGVDRAAAGPAGILYLYRQSTGTFRYLDAANGVHPLLNEAGTGGFTFGRTVGMSELVYDAGTHSLIAAFGGDTGFPGCVVGVTCVYRIPLNAEGTQVTGPAQSSTYDVSPAAPEDVFGIGYTATGDILVVVDTNTNNQEPRMLAVDPITLAITPYALSGRFIGAAVISAGTFSAALGRALIVDTGADSIRAFAPGQVGRGTLLPHTGFSGPGAAEIARLVQIGNPSGVTDAPGPIMPSGWTLQTDGPIPFTTHTRMHLAAPQAGHVHLAIYDVAGRLVRTLLDRQVSAGVHAAVWDGRDGAGQPAPAGVYFARLRTGGGVSSRTLVRMTR